MAKNEDLEKSEISMMAKAVVSMYKVVWSEVEKQFFICSAEERMRIYSLISPFINNMMLMASEDFAEEELEELDKQVRKRKIKR